MKKRHNLSIGNLGEIAASKYLTSLGYKIIERNFRKRYSEIDIVAKEANILVFVEVKTRCDSSFGNPEESITPYKLRKLIQSAHYYKLLHPDLPSSLRIDVVGVYLTMDNKIAKIKHFKNITL
jgi:putative endonuclease